MTSRRVLSTFTVTLVITASMTTLQLLSRQVTAAPPSCSQQCRQICTTSFTDPHKRVSCENDCTTRCANPNHPTSGGSPPSGAPAFDLVSARKDDNGLLLNPITAGQNAGFADLGTSFYSCFSKLHYSGSIGPLRVSPACTSQPVSTDQANDNLHKPMCSAETSPVGFNGHINWFNVTYQGDVSLDDSDLSDHDVNFNLSPDPGISCGGPAGSIARCSGVPIGAFFTCLPGAGDWTDDVHPRCGPHWAPAMVQQDLHLEMKSDETIDNFEGAWWQLLRNHHNDLQYGLGKGAKLGRGIVTGLFGYDCEHDCHIELHPILAMAIRTSDWVGFSAWGGAATNNPANSETWQIFVRSSGSEGYCSAGNNTDHGLSLSSYTFRLPWKPLPPSGKQWQGVRVLSSEFWDHDRHPVSPPVVNVQQGAGVLVTFPTLPRPGGDRAIDGELSLQFVSSDNQPQSDLNLTIDNITNQKSKVFQSRDGSVVVRHKIDNNSDVRIIAAKDVTIVEKIDQHSIVNISAGGRVYIGQGIDQHSQANITAGDSVTIVHKIDQHSVATITTQTGDVLIPQGIDQHSQATITAGGSVTIGQKIDQHSVAIITTQTGNVSIPQKIDQHSWARINAPKGAVSIGQGVDQHSHLHFRARSNSIGKVNVGSTADGDLTAGFDPKESGPGS